MQSGIPAFLHFGNRWEMQEFLLIPAYSGIVNLSGMAEWSFIQLGYMQSEIPAFLHLGNRWEIQEFLVIRGKSSSCHICSLHRYSSRKSFLIRKTASVEDV
jgi:hypothetical protein